MNQTLNPSFNLSRLPREAILAHTRGRGADAALRIALVRWP